MSVVEGRGRIRLQNLFASKRIETHLDLIGLIFGCFVFFAYLIYSIHSLIFALKYSLTSIAHCLCPLSTGQYLLSIANFPLFTAHCLLPTVYCPLSNGQYQLSIAHCPLFKYSLRSIAHCLFPTVTHCFCLLSTGQCLLSIANCPLSNG